VVEVAPLQLVAGVMADEEVPAERLVLGRERVERRHVVVVGQAILARRRAVAADELPGVAAGFQQEDLAARLGEARRDGAPAGAGPHHDVLGAVGRAVRLVVHGASASSARRPAERPGRYSVFRNSIRSSFSRSLSAGSSANRSVPK
jgi:hypothetical protein